VVVFDAETWQHSRSYLLGGDHVFGRGSKSVWVPYFGLRGQASSLCSGAVQYKYPKELTDEGFQKGKLRALSNDIQEMRGMKLGMRFMDLARKLSEESSDQVSEMNCNPRSIDENDIADAGLEAIFKNRYNR
jgi:hypothetical protein